MIKLMAMTPNVEPKGDVVLFGERDAARIREFKTMSQKELLKLVGIEYNNQIRSDCNIFELSVAESAGKLL